MVMDNYSVIKRVEYYVLDHSSAIAAIFGHLHSIRDSIPPYPYGGGCQITPGDLMQIDMHLSSIERQLNLLSRRDY